MAWRNSKAIQMGLGGAAVLAAYFITTRRKTTQEGSRPSYTIVPLRSSRLPQTDYMDIARQKHMIHVLTEMDVTQARGLLRAHKERTGEALSFTAYLVACVAKAVDADKMAHAYRQGRRKLVIFEDVDVNTIIERPVGDRTIPVPYVIRAANRKSFREIHEEIRAAQGEQVEVTGRLNLMKWYWLLPPVLGRAFWRLLLNNPFLMKRTPGTVSVSAVGMFGQGAGWGIPITAYTLQVIVGGIAEKPGVVNGKIEPRQYLSLTLCFDHDIIDGAPAARFTGRLKELIERASSLDFLSNEAS
jgi:pyruvate/2-oxoglutarate dehydrogenase complex dihydrolipoamide acyltransferase (E2) component